MNAKEWVACVALAAVSASANAASQIDSEGNGFVGKGDIQAVMVWNNQQLQDNAASLRFRMLAGGGASWKCEGVNASGKTIVTVQQNVPTRSSTPAANPYCSSAPTAKRGSIWR
jgi:hypothetical protein